MKVIRPSSDPVAPVTDVGGLFDRGGTKHLQGALQTGSSQSFKLLFMQRGNRQSPACAEPQRLGLQSGSALGIGHSRVIFSVSTFFMEQSSAFNQHPNLTVLVGNLIT